MATDLAFKWPTLVDFAKMTHNDMIMRIVDTLAVKNAMIRDMPVMTANDTMSHVIARDSVSPTASLVGFNEGTDPQRYIPVQDVEHIAMAEVLSEVDSRLLSIQPDPIGYRSLRDIKFSVALANKIGETMLDGVRATDPKSINGLKERCKALSTSGPYVISNGSSNTGSLTSAYVVKWDESACYGIIPKNDPTAGLRVKDLGEYLTLDSGGTKKLAVYGTIMQQYFGLCVEDLRYLGRLANINTASSTNAFDDDALIELLSYFPDNDGCVIYVNRVLEMQMNKLAKARTNVNYTSSEMWGVPVTLFRGVPVRRCDWILNTETTVS